MRRLILLIEVMEGSKERVDNAKEIKDIDIYRDTPLRLVGYTNEVGEAFRPLIHKNWVLLSYATASMYVLADVYDKTTKMREQLSMGDVSNLPPSAEKKIVIVGADTLLWQALASVIIPGITINRLCASSLFLLKKTTKLPKNTRKWTTTVIGLASIPFIVKPIDNLVDIFMDKTVRQWTSMK